jgi:hypothetical protein
MIKKVLIGFFGCFLLSLSVAKATIIPGVEGPFLNFLDGKILVDIKLTQVELPAGIGFTIPKTEKSTFTISPNIEGGSLVSFQVDIEDIKLVDIGIGVSNTLPDGRPIVGLAGGELKDSLRLDLDERFYNVSIFYHKTLSGVYIPFNFDLGPLFKTIAIPLKWKGKNVGLISVAQAEGSLKASGTVFLNLKAFKENKELQERLRLSKEYPGKVF